MVDAFGRGGHGVPQPIATGLELYQVHRSADKIAHTRKGLVVEVGLQSADSQVDIEGVVPGTRYEGSKEPHLLDSELSTQDNRGAPGGVARFIRSLEAYHPLARHSTTPRFGQYIEIHVLEYSKKSFDGRQRISKMRSSIKRSAGQHAPGLGCPSRNRQAGTVIRDEGSLTVPTDS